MTKAWRRAVLASLIAIPFLRSGAQGAATLDAVARAMGGRDRIAAITGISMIGRGDNYNLGQSLTPVSELPRYEVTSWTRTLDLAHRRLLVELKRQPRFVTGNSAEQTVRTFVDDSAAFDVMSDSTMRRLAGVTARDRVEELWNHPVALLQAAWSANAEVVELPPHGQSRLISVTVAGRRFLITVDPVTSLPTRIQRDSYNALLGDVVLETEFADWRDVNGIKLPARLIDRVANRWTVSDLRATTVDVVTDRGAGLTPPARIDSASPPGVSVNVEEIAPGVWYLNGQSHHSVAIEQQGSIVLVEAPQSEERTLAVIDKARSLVPGKPVSLVINTHHHFDHAGGIRAAISQGLTVVTQVGNRDFFERTVFAGRHTIMKDSLARHPMPLHLAVVGDKYVLRDSVRPIEVYYVIGSAHSATMLMVYLPAERLLVQADLYNPPPANPSAPVTFPFAANLLENIQRRGLQVDRVVGIHGRVVPLSEIQAAARAP